VAKAYILGTADIEHSGYGAKDALTVWGGGYSGTNVYGGVYMLNKTASTGDGNLWPNGQIGSFCIELNEYAPSSTIQYDVVMPESVYNSFLVSYMGTAKADYLRELWGRFYLPEWADGGPYSTYENSTAEAFAAAIWEIVNEDLPVSPLNYDVTVDGTPGTGGFKAENVDTSLANYFLHQLTGSGPMADLRAFVYQGKQDFLVEVPEPTTIALLGISGLLSLLRRRRNIA
jgi:hypothetical protein